MPTLLVSNFNIICATLGGWISIFGLVSYLFKERLFLSEARTENHLLFLRCTVLRIHHRAVISLLAGVALSPHGANLIRPLEYVTGIEADLAAVTLYFSRLVLGVQLIIAGVQLPAKYVFMRRHDHAPLVFMLGRQ